MSALHNTSTSYSPRIQHCYDNGVQLHPSISIIPEPPRKRSLPSGKDWEGAQPKIKRLYVDEKLTLKETITRMKDIEGFDASARTYKQKIKEWGLEKNIPRRYMEEIVATIEQRHNVGKETDVYFRGQKIESKKLERFKKRRTVQPITNGERKEKDDEDEEEEDEEENEHEIASARLFGVRYATPQPKNGGMKELSYEPLNLFRKFNSVDALSRELSKDFPPDTTNAVEQDEDGLRQVLNSSNSQKTIGDIIGSLHGIVRAHRQNKRLGSALAEMERLVAGLLCFFGTQHTTFMQYAAELGITYHELEQTERRNALTKLIFASNKTVSPNKTVGPALTRKSYENLIRLADLYCDLPPQELKNNAAVETEEQHIKQRYIPTTRVSLTVSFGNTLWQNKDYEKLEQVLLDMLRYLSNQENLDPEQLKELLDCLPGKITCGGIGMFVSRHEFETLLEKLQMNLQRCLKDHPGWHIFLVYLAKTYSRINLFENARKLYSELLLREKCSMECPSLSISDTHMVSTALVDFAGYCCAERKEDLVTLAVDAFGTALIYNGTRKIPDEDIRKQFQNAQSQDPQDTVERVRELFRLMTVHGFLEPKVDISDDSKRAHLLARTNQRPQSRPGICGFQSSFQKPARWESSVYQDSRTENQHHFISSARFETPDHKRCPDSRSNALNIGLQLDAMQKSKDPNRVTLSIHSDNSQTDTSSNSGLKCAHPGCGKTIARKGDLNRHMLKHTGERPFSCPEPGCLYKNEKGFSRKDKLVAHQRARHGPAS